MSQVKTDLDYDKNITLVNDLITYLYTELNE